MVESSADPMSFGSSALFIAVVVVTLALVLTRRRHRLRPRRIMPGVVIIKSVMDEGAQAKLLKVCLDVGYARWLLDDGRLNAWRQRRGRLYDAVKRYPAELPRLCKELVEAAQTVEKTFPMADQTHLLMLYYTDLTRGLGFHRDDGKIDGKSDAPVVSFSLGCACDFHLKHHDKDPAMTVRLNSGDAILFGGPARYIMHAVRTMHPGTCPPKVAEVHSTFSEDNGDAFRLNLTFRHAPELTGLEDTDRFYHFGSATRNYLDTERRLGTDAARQEAHDRRRNRKKKTS